MQGNVYCSLDALLGTGAMSHVRLGSLRKESRSMAKSGIGEIPIQSVECGYKYVFPA